MSFDWQTEEETGWQEKNKPVETAVSQSFWRRWGFGLVMLLGLVAVWIVVQWQIDQRITAATGDIETELLATHNFVLQTAVSRDESLFRANLSGRNPDWGGVQQSLLNEGLLLDRPMFGWQHVAEQPRLTMDDVVIALSPDLQAAELIYPQHYTVHTPAGLTETVTFQQTAVYRSGTARWLYAPPLDEFWGDWVTNTGKQLTMVYSTRDADVAERLATDLEALLSRLCRELADLNCGDALRVHLRLDREPDSVLTSNDIETILSGGLRLNLPSPTLIGLPTDEASYQALFEAYGVQLATAVLAHQVNYDCCHHQLFFRALRDYQLAQLGLQAWPLIPEMYGQLLAAGFNGDVSRHWTRGWHQLPFQPLLVHQQEEPEPVWQQVYLLVEFLNTRETAVSPADMIRLLDRNSYEGWLDDIFTEGSEPTLFMTHFLQYIHSQSIASQPEAPPIPLPNGTVTLICDNFSNGFSSGRNNGVYQYDVATGEWQERLRFSNEGQGYTYADTRDGQRILLMTNNFGGSKSNTLISLLTPEGTTVLEEIETDNPPDGFVNYYFVSASGDFFARSVYSSEDFSQTEIGIRKTACPTADCPQLVVHGWPTFSPDGQNLIGMAFPEDGSGVLVPAELESEIFVASTDLQSAEAETVGRGGYPFWLDNSTFGYWQMAENGIELVTAVSAQSRQHVLIHEARLLEELPSEEQLSTLSPGQIVANPQNPQELLVQVRKGITSGPTNRSYLFRLTLSADLSSVVAIDLLRIDPLPQSVSYSPDGRYITILNYESPTNNHTWTLLDQETGQAKEPFRALSYGLSWSPDGQWFVHFQSNYLLLRAPAHDYEYFIPHGLEGCNQAILSVDE